jgi:MOSC domain-containing protein
MATTLAALHVYPVKGLKGIELKEARATERGLEHDRRFMVVDGDGVFLTQRDHPAMATIWTDIDDGRLTLAAPDMGEVSVPLVPDAPASMKVQVWRSTVEAAHVSNAADVWLSESLGFACRLVYMPEASRRFSNPDYAGEGRQVGFADGYAYLVTGEASLEDLNRRLAERGHPALPMNRFRPNLVVAGAAPYAEDGWKDVRVGGAVLRAAKPCGRCQVTTTDQSTGIVVGPEPLATLATYRDSAEFGVMFGMNYVTAQPGSMRVGDAVTFR